MRFPLKFAVQREDPRLEESLLDKLGSGPKRFFGVTAAGCTLMQLSTRPDLVELVGADGDRRQTAWARFRMQAARLLSRKDFCRVTGISQIDSASREALIEKVLPALPPEERAWMREERAFFVGGAFDDGVYERMWAAWRAFIELFVAPREQIEAIFAGDAAARDALLTAPLWPVSFEAVCLHDLLRELFGPQAVQHSPPGSYARFFQARFEWALSQPDAPENPYLSHVLRGRYGGIDRDEALPDYLHSARYPKLAAGSAKVTLVNEKVSEALRSHPGPYQMIELSNILDWSSDAESDELAAPVLESLAPGGWLVIRQLNNVRPLPALWTKSLDFDPVLDRQLLASERSFFYSAVRVGRKSA